MHAHKLNRMALRSFTASATIKQLAIIKEVMFCVANPVFKMEIEFTDAMAPTQLVAQ